MGVMAEQLDKIIDVARMQVKLFRFSGQLRRGSRQ
jgi:hypothetical protein